MLQKPYTFVLQLMKTPLLFSKVGSRFTWSFQINIRLFLNI